jgi:predicted ester cyclase
VGTIIAMGEQRKNVCVYSVFSGTHTGPGGPCPPTGKKLNKSVYVYIMDFDGEKIRSGAFSVANSAARSSIAHVMSGLQPARDLCI